MWWLDEARVATENTYHANSRICCLLSFLIPLFYLRVYNQHNYLMGQTLSEPITTKESSEGGDARVKYGASCMQGWRISKSFEAFLSTRQLAHGLCLQLWKMLIPLFPNTRIQVQASLLYLMVMEVCIIRQKSGDGGVSLMIHSSIPIDMNGCNHRRCRGKVQWWTSSWRSVRIKVFQGRQYKRGISKWISSNGWCTAERYALRSIDIYKGSSFSIIRSWTWKRDFWMYSCISFIDKGQCSICGMCFKGPVIYWSWLKKKIYRATLVIQGPLSAAMVVP